MRIICKITIIGILFLLSISSQAQTENQNSIVYLNDGSQIEGIIKEWKYGDYLIIRLNDGIDLRIPSKDIKNVETLKKIVSKERLREGYFFPKIGVHYLNGNEGRRFEGKDGYAISASYNYGYKYWLNAGLGAGHYTYVDENDERIVAIYADISGASNPKLPALQYQLGIGYGFNVTAEGINEQTNINLLHSGGGLFFSPTIGILFGQSRMKHGAHIGYVFQRAQYTIMNNFNELDIVQSITYKRITIGYHIQF